MIFAISAAVLLPNEPEWLKAFRATHMAHEPHITLVQPRTITSTQHEEIRQLLADYLSKKQLPGHQISLRFHEVLEHDVSTGADTDLCLMLALDRNEQLLTMQHELVDLLKDFVDYSEPHRKAYEDDFRPHLTLTSGDLTHDAYAAILKELPTDHAVNGIVEEIQLLSKEDPGQLHSNIVSFHL